jgi:hypothetical protein
MLVQPAGFVGHSKTESAGEVQTPPRNILRDKPRSSSRRRALAIQRRVLVAKATAMEIAFDSKELRTICESEPAAQREYGLSVSEALRHRLADLRSASTVGDLVAGAPHPAGGPESEYLLVQLCEGYSLAFSANHRQNPETPNGQVDWSGVSRIKLLRIEAQQ